MAAVLARENFYARTKRPQVNLSANWRDEVGEICETSRVVAPSLASSTSADFEAMFPNLDAALVQTLVSEAHSQQHAMDTLLTLAASMNEPTQASAQTKDLGLTDANSFPMLTDADGWQVVRHGQLDEKDEADLGIAWCERAKSIADKPAPTMKATAASIAGRPKRSSKQGGHPHSKIAPADSFETEYECRQRLGRKRVQDRAKFGRRKPTTIGDSNGDVRRSNDSVSQLLEEESS